MLCTAYRPHRKNLNSFAFETTYHYIETSGGNHTRLKEWNAEHGSATVESRLTK
ncbi:hypothetical protein [Pseudomonas violetae]|uniref:hypothetical protein n=1 Tax=Pseudomonas violetae TaxID=2915813 RepID=UPI003D11121E